MLYTVLVHAGLTADRCSRDQASLDDPARGSRRSDRQPVRTNELMVVGRDTDGSLKVWE